MTSSTLTRWAGRSLVAIAVLHTLVFLPHPYWSQWLSGQLWTEPAADSVATFWALPGGFVAIGILFGLLICRMARDGYPVPGYVGWSLLAWSIGCVALIGPSGFILGTIPAGLLIAADIRSPHRPCQYAGLTSARTPQAPAPPCDG